jgi:hypothetical protein
MKVQHALVTLFSGSAAPAIPWYLSGGVAAANCLGAYRGKGAASKAASLVNLANPGTYDLVDVNTVTWSAQVGWSGANTKMLKTGIIPGTSLNYTMIICFDDGGSGTTGCLIGANTIGAFYIFPNSSGKRKYFYQGGTGGAGNQIDGVKTSGVLAIAGTNCYYNGQPDGTLSQGSNISTPEIYLLGRNNAGAISNEYLGNEIAAAIYNTVLTDAQVLAISAAMTGF